MFPFRSMLEAKEDIIAAFSRGSDWLGCCCGATPRSDEPGFLLRCQLQSGQAS